MCVCVCVYRGFPGSSDGKESACNAGDLASIPELGRSLGEGNGNPLQLFLPGEFHGQRSLANYSPWGCNESDTTEQLVYIYIYTIALLTGVFSNNSLFDTFILNSVKSLIKNR